MDFMAKFTYYFYLIFDSLLQELFIVSYSPIVRQSVLHFYQGIYLSSFIPLALSITNFLLLDFELRSSATSTYTSPACLVPLSEKITTVNLVYFYFKNYLLFLEHLLSCIKIHIALNFQFFIECSNALINLFPLFYLCCFLTYINQVLPRFQYTETMHGNFKASVTVLISAINPNLKILVLLIAILTIQFISYCIRNIKIMLRYKRIIRRIK